MVTPDELRALVGALPSPNDEIILRASHYLARDDREGIETAHNLVKDVINNMVVAKQDIPFELFGIEVLLYEQRIDAYGAIGRPADMTAPYWRP